MKNLGKLLEIKTLFAFALTSLLIGSLIQQYLGRGTTTPNLDFYDYYFAAQVVHDNPRANLYSDATVGNPQTRYAPIDSEISVHAKAAGVSGIMLYLYPPLLADIIAPFSGIPVYLAAALWRVLNLTLVFVSVVFLARMMRVPLLSFEFVILAVAVYSFFPIHESLWIGQATLIMLVLWTAGIAAYFDGRIVLSAIVFALATAFKITPVLLLPLFFICKDRRWIISYLAASLGLVAAMLAINGWQNISVYPSVMSAMSGGIPAARNKTLGSLVAWVFYGKPFDSDLALKVIANLPTSLLIMEKAVSGAFYLFCLFLAWRSRQIERASRAATIAVFALVALCVAPVSWRHGYSVAFIALAIYWVKSLRTPRPRILHSVLLTLTTFTFGCVIVETAVESPLPQICKLILAASWIVFTVLFSVDILYHAIDDGQTGFANGGKTEGVIS